MFYKVNTSSLTNKKVWLIAGVAIPFSMIVAVVLVMPIMALDSSLETSLVTLVLSICLIVTSILWTATRNATLSISAHAIVFTPAYFKNKQRVFLKDNIGFLTVETGKEQFRPNPLRHSYFSPYKSYYLTVQNKGGVKNRFEFSYTDLISCTDELQTLGYVNAQQAKSYKEYISEYWMA